MSLHDAESEIATEITIKMQ